MIIPLPILQEQKQLETLASVLRAILPETTLAVLFNEEGDPYMHLYTPDGAIDYYIEIVGGGWEGHPRGRLDIGILPAVRGTSAGVVAFTVATAFVTWLFGAAKVAKDVLEAVV